MKRGLARTQEMSWRDDLLLFRGRISNYAVVRDGKYPTMWRVKRPSEARNGLRPDGTLSDIVNRSRAKDAAMALLDRDLRTAESPSEGSPVRLSQESVPGNGSLSEMLKSDAARIPAQRPNAAEPGRHI